MEMRPIDLLRDALPNAKKQGDAYIALCPAHGDTNPSLHFGEDKEGNGWVKCWAGCETKDILAALRIDQAGLFVDKKRENTDFLDEYLYEDENRNPLYLVRRTLGKEFPVFHKEGDRWVKGRNNIPLVIWRLPQVKKAIAEGRAVWCVEGEKDVLTMENFGFVATTSPGGAGLPGQKPKWKPEYADSLYGGVVFILADNDEAGRAHANACYTSLKGKAEAYLVTLPELPEWTLPEKGDVSDWARAGGTREMLEQAAQQVRSKAPRPISSQEATRQCLEDVDRRARGEIKGLPWPEDAWPTLAEVMGPIEPGTFTVIAARPSIGKTIFAMQLQAWLCDQGHRVLFVTRELTPIRMVRRHMTRHGASMPHLRSGDLDQRDQDACRAYISRQAKWDLRYDHTSCTVADIEREAKRFSPDIVILDYLQRLTYPVDNEYLAVTQLVNELQDLTLTTNIPMVCLSQLRRPPQGQEHRPPSMTDTRGSGAVEERATSVVLLHRKFNVTVDQATKREIAGMKTEDGWFIVAKNADGEADRMIPTVTLGHRMTIAEPGTRV